MVMIGDIAFLVESMSAFLRCSRRACPGGTTHDLVSTADPSTQMVGEHTTKSPELQDLSAVSTDGDVSDAESTADSAELETSSNGKHDVLELQPPVTPPPGFEGVSLGNKNGDIVKESCLNKWAQPFVPGAQVGGLDYVSSVANASCSPETEVHARLAHVISNLSPEDAATVSAFLKLKLAKETQAVQIDDCGTHQHELCTSSNLPAPIGFRPPPGLCQEQKMRIEPLRQPLPPGLVLPHAQSRAPKIQDDSEVGEKELRSNLNKLAQFDPASIFLVRKINRLGFNSADLLKAYFEKFGMVECVLVSHSIEKPSPGRRKPRVRPAGLAFVVMDKPEDVSKILCFRSEHVVQDVSILASPYEQHERWSPGCSEDCGLNSLGS